MKRILLSAVFTLALLLYPRINANADLSLDDGTLHEIKVTGYCDNEQLCSSGVKPREGIAAIGHGEYEGCVAIVTFEDGTIRMYEILDTGADWSGVGTGDTLDVWCPTEEECYELTSKALIQIVHGKG